jgi:hypothetical protein
MPGRGGTHEANERGGGATGIGLAIAGTIVAFFATLPFMFIVVLYVFLTIYAIVRAIGLGVVIHFVGRSLTPKKRREKH